MRFSLGKRGAGDSSRRGALNDAFGNRPAPGQLPPPRPVAALPTETPRFDEPAPLHDDGPALIGERRGETEPPTLAAPAGTVPATNGGAYLGAGTNGAGTNGGAGNGHATNGGATNGFAANGVATNGGATHTETNGGPHGAPVALPAAQVAPVSPPPVAAPAAEAAAATAPAPAAAPAAPASQTVAPETMMSEAPTSRVSVVDEQPPRPAPPAGASEEEYKWHTYKVYPSGRPDAVEFIDTYRAFGKNRILRGLNMGLPEGMVSMILGPSGTGKSVCIKHMVGLLYPDQGDVLVHGRSVPNMVDDELFEMRKKFGLLFQDGALFGSMNLYDNVAFPLRQHTEKGEDEIEDIVMRRLNEVGLGHSRDKYPNELSGGMRKRAGFARALVLGPDIVLFDEPDSGLDPVRTSLLGELILEVHRDMMDEAKASEKPHLPTFCVITHNVMMARRTADYINVLWKGRIVEAGPTEDMLNSPNPFIRQFLAGESMGPLTMD
jgi:phospholipid/cholesterol/gamma-HCH transport system ATP-binding protein